MTDPCKTLCMHEHLMRSIDALTAERDALKLMASWAYSKMHSRTFTSTEDALELDSLKLYVEHGIYP